MLPKKPLTLRAWTKKRPSPDTLCHKEDGQAKEGYYIVGYQIAD
jgi:hypothetical protein